MEKRKIILAVTGASGSLYAKLLLDRVQGKGLGAKGTGLEAQGPGHVMQKAGKPPGAVPGVQGTGQKPQGKALGPGHETQDAGQAHSTGYGVQYTEQKAQSKGRKAKGAGLIAKGPGQEVQGKGLGSQGTGSGAQGAEIAIIFSDNAREIWKYELGSEFLVPGGMTLYKNNDFYAPFASGSSDWDTMIICPASMGIIGRIAGGISNDLITRAADVMLKERRRLIVVPRETPYSLIHINNMKLITEAGAIVCPATPSFYHKPSTIEDLALTVVERILDLAGLRGDHRRWQTPPEKY